MNKIILLVFLSIGISANSQNPAEKDPSFNSFTLPSDHYYVHGQVRKTIVGSDNKLYLLEKGIEGFDKIVKLNNNSIEQATYFGAETYIGDFLIQPDGKLIVAGAFYDNLPTSIKIIRLNADFSLDTSFSNTLSMENYDSPRLLLQPDGKTLLFGTFEIIENNATIIKYMLRINSDGTLDTTFNYFSNSYYHKVDSFAIQPDGKILVATGIDGNNPNARRVTRLNSDGSLDASFLQGEGAVSYGISKILVLNDGRILVGGNFTYYNMNFEATKRIVMLESDGTIDPSFNPGLAGTSRGLDYHPFSNSHIPFVEDMIQQTDEKIVIIGFFNSFNASSPNCENIIRLNLDGSRDESFTSTTQKNNIFLSNYSTLNRIALDEDDNLFIGGLFKEYNSQIVHNIVKVDNQGNLISNFDNICRGFDAGVEIIREFNNGKILVFGNFDKYNGEVARRLVRLNADGSLDSSFNAMFDENYHALYYTPITEIIIQPDNKILIIGDKHNPSFNYDNSPFNGILRINEDGTVDTTFNVGEGFNHPLPSSWANPMAIALQPDGKIIVSGAIGMYKGIQTGGVIRILQNGELDTSFNTMYGMQSNYIFVQNDGKIIINNRLAFTSQRLNSDGTEDLFFANLQRPVIAVQSDGKYLVQPFINGQNYIIRLLPDGTTVDETYEPFPVPTGYQLNRLELQPNNKLLMTYPDNRLVRVNTDGFIDETFDMPVGFSVNYGFIINGFNRFPTKVLSNGKIMIGSSYEEFYQFNNVEERNIVRLMGGDTVLSNDDFSKVQKQQILIYPNPSENILNLNNTENISIKNISVYNLLGQKIITIPNAEQVNKVDVSKLSRGQYLLVLQTENGVLNAKFMKK